MAIAGEGAGRRPGASRPSTDAMPAGAHWAWVAGAGLLGFGLSAVFSAGLGLPRGLFLAPYLLASTAFLEAYRRRAGVDAMDAMGTRWQAGVSGALVSGAFVVWAVLRQPPSPLPEHASLQVLWLGVAYGAVDGLLLSVLPVAATWRALSAAGRTSSKGGRLVDGLVALAASLAVTAAYHLGYVEFRGAALVGPLIGCGVMSLAYIVTRNPLAAVLSHVAMHVAAVLHGVDSTVQLPPHG